MYLNEFDATMQMIQGKWKIMILYYIHAHQQARFNALQRHIADVSHKTLTSQLRALEMDGLITRKVYEAVPPKVEYSLTAKGLSILPVLDVICEWGLQHVDAQLMQRQLCDEE